MRCRRRPSALARGLKPIILLAIVVATHHLFDEPVQRRMRAWARTDRAAAADPGQKGVTEVALSAHTEIERPVPDSPRPEAGGAGPGKGAAVAGGAFAPSTV